MDIGKRPATRQRRQLPIAFEALPKRHSEQRGVLPILTSTSKHNDIQDDEEEEEDFAFMERSSSRSFDWAGHLRRRKRKSNNNTTRRQEIVEDDRRARQKRELLEKDCNKQIIVWICCGGWAIFLIFRIVSSIYLNDYEQLNVTRYFGG